MNKQEFLNQLRSHLRKLPKSEIEDILRDQDEFITDAVASGRVEKEVIQSIGDPKKFAANIIAESKIQQAESASSFRKQMRYTFAAIIAFLALAPLNAIVILGPFLILVSLLMSGFLSALSTVAVGLLGVVGFFTTAFFIPVGFWPHLSLLSFLVGLVGAGAILVLLMIYLARLFLRATVGYIRWNYNFMKNKFNT
jgi:uncharacterized membrane protein